MRMQWFKWMATSVVTLGLVACGGSSTGTLSGTVTDMESGAALAGITVTTTPATKSVTTDASGKYEIKDVDADSYVVHFAGSGYVPEDESATVKEDKTATADTSIGSQSYYVAEAARDFLALTKLENTDPNYLNVNIAAAALQGNLYDGDTSNDPKVVSVRADTAYAIGHVPTAINLPWKTVADDASLELLGDPSSAGPMVNYCYTGHTGGIATAVLDVLGYRVQNMKYGIAAWTDDTAVRAGATDPDQTHDFTVETDVNTATDTFTPPWLAAENVTTPQEAVKAAAQAYLADPEMAPTISAQTLFDNLNDGDTTNDPFIISVRAASAYAVGHIPGAINIPWNEVALADNLAKIPTDREIVIYCYTGHTGAIATGVLGVLGYHKVKNLKYGMAGWTQDASVRVTAAFDTATEVHQFPTVAGTDPGTVN